MQQGSFNEIDKLGSKLSLVIGCAVVYAIYEKNMFTCKHGIPFPIYRLKADSNWDWVKEEHDKQTKGG